MARQIRQDQSLNCFFFFDFKDNAYRFFMYKEIIKTLPTNCKKKYQYFLYQFK